MALIVSSQFNLLYGTLFKQIVVFSVYDNPFTVNRSSLLSVSIFPER